MSNSTENSVNQPDWFVPLRDWLGGVKKEIELALSTLTEHTVTIEFGQPETYSDSIIDEALPDKPIILKVGFGNEEIGNWYFLFSQSLAAQLADLAMMGEGTVPFDEALHPDTLSEIWGQIAAALEISLNELIDGEVSIGMPELIQESEKMQDYLSGTVLVRWDVDIESVGKGILLLAVEPVLARVFGEKEESKEDSGSPGEDISKEVSKDKDDSVEPVSKKPQPVITKPVFEDFGRPGYTDKKKAEETRNIDILLDISLPITIELGRTTMLIKDVLELGQGSIIELDKLSGEPVDLYVNDKKFAKGEVVVIEENFGVRITELIQIDQRLKALK